jgi:hypothetical protein
MPRGRHPKPGPVERPQVTLRGRTLQALQPLAAKMKGDLGDAVRAGLDDWLKTKAAAVLFKSYGLDLAAIVGEEPRPRAEVVKLEPKASRIGEGEQVGENESDRGIS